MGKSNRPKDDPFHQHQLCGTHIFLDALHTFPMFLVVGLVFVGIGIWLMTEITSIQQMSFIYSSCMSVDNSSQSCENALISKNLTFSYQSCYCVFNFVLTKNMEGNVNFYYTLSNFYQNYKRYVSSKDDMQLHGNSGPPSDNCQPLQYDPATNYPYAPCGAIANSLFNDTFLLYYSFNNTTINVPWTSTNISWYTDRTQLFGQPSSFFQTAKPPNWKFSALQRSSSAYNGDEELIVWMRMAAFPSFRKLHRKLILNAPFSKGLLQGNYSLYINYSFPVSPFNGTKGFMLTTDHWLGSNDLSICIIYFISGGVHLIASIILIIFDWKKKMATT